MLALDAEPTDESVRRHVGFAVEGIPQRVGFRILTGEERAAILESAPRRAAPRARAGDPGAAALSRSRAGHPGVGQGRGRGERRRHRPGPVAALQGARSLHRARRLRAREQERRLHPHHADARPLLGAGRHGAGAPRRARRPRRPAVGAALRRGRLAVGGLAELQGAVSREGGAAPRAAARTWPTTPAARPSTPRASRSTVKTEAFPPLAKFAARFGIIEANADPALPVTLRNLEPQVLARMLNVSGSPKDWVEWVQGRIFRVPPSRVADILPWLRRVGDGGARQVGLRRAPIARGRPSPSRCPSRTAPRRSRWSASRSPAPASTSSSSRARASAPRCSASRSRCTCPRRRW